MTPEQQRIAIAQACGWEAETYGPSWCESETKMPDYLNDLNAMNEVEKLITDAQWIDYDLELMIVTACNGYLQRNRVSANAAQRAEAFLRTIGKWVES